MNKRSRQSHPEIQAGARFGRWVVLSPPKYQGASLAHDCRCDCGTTKTVRADRLRNGASKSCGCAARESLITHGFTCKETRRESREYWIWNTMVRRCTNPKVKNWADYGGRGITVCERWMKFENFYADMGRRPSSKHSIERINNDGPYDPGNCTWALRSDQAKNKRNNRLIEANGERLHLAEWARRLGADHSTIIGRIARGWPESKAVTTPIRKASPPNP